MNELGGIRRPRRPRKALMIEDQVSKHLREKRGWLLVQEAKRRGPNLR